VNALAAVLILAAAFAAIVALELFRPERLKLQFPSRNGTAEAAPLQTFYRGRRFLAVRAADFYCSSLDCMELHCGVCRQRQSVCTCESGLAQWEGEGGLCVD
jgi:hypothetical protein